MNLPDEQGIPETRNIHFTVTDGSKPVNGANIVVGDKNATTGSAGGCSISNITDGEHSVTVTADNYIDKSETITVSENNTEFTIILEYDDENNGG